MRATRVRLAAIAIVIGAIACGTYEHTNPYDPDVPVLVTVSGPDTLFSIDEHATFTVQTIPVFPDSAIDWASSDTFELTPAGRASFKLSAPPALYPATQTLVISALVGRLDTVGTITNKVQPTTIWRHSGMKQVVVTQRVTHIQLRCPSVNACDTLSAGSSWSVWADGFDALNHKIYSLTSATANPLTGLAVATFAVRDTAIARVLAVGIRASTATALKSGSTWIVATRGPLLDSLRLVVR